MLLSISMMHCQVLLLGRFVVGSALVVFNWEFAISEMFCLKEASTLSSCLASLSDYFVSIAKENRVVMLLLRMPLPQLWCHKLVAFPSPLFMIMEVDTNWNICGWIWEKSVVWGVVGLMFCVAVGLMISFHSLGCVDCQWKYHLRSCDWLKVLRSATPSPPSCLGMHTISHLTKFIFPSFYICSMSKEFLPYFVYFCDYPNW